MYYVHDNNRLKAVIAEHTNYIPKNKIVNFCASTAEPERRSRACALLSVVPVSVIIGR